MSHSNDWLPLAYATLTAACFAAYVLMDGWDLGVGILYPLVARRADRDQLLQTIEPFWDANETWLVFGGMVLLLGFPLAYSQLLTQLYVPAIAMLLALVLRGVSYEFRYQGGALREFWGFVFAAGSILAAFAQGCMLGRVVEGLAPTDSLSPVLTALRDGFPLVCGIGLIGGYALLGACWLILKTEDALQTMAREVGQSALLLTAILLIIVSTFTPLVSPHVASRWLTSNGWVLAAVAVTSHCAVLWKLWSSLWRSNDRRPLQWATALFILSFVGIAFSLFPYIIPYQYTLFEAANDPATLRFAGVGICIVLPVVILYLGLGYRVFRGKTVRQVALPMEAPSVAARKTSGHQADLHMS
jgi:cytochrome bd ubiquinol oxidase subunit II